MNDAGNLTGACLKQTLTKCEDRTFRRESSLPARIFTVAITWLGYQVAWLSQRLFHSGYSMLLSIRQKRCLDPVRLCKIWSDPLNDLFAARLTVARNQKQSQREFSASHRNRRDHRRSRIRSGTGSARYRSCFGIQHGRDRHRTLRS